MDTARFLANYTNIITARQIHRIIKENLKDWLHKKAKRRVSRESKIYRKAGSCNLEYAV